MCPTRILLRSSKWTLVMCPKLAPAGSIGQNTSLRRMGSIMMSTPSPGGMKVEFDGYGRIDENSHPKGWDPIICPLPGVNRNPGVGNNRTRLSMILGLQDQAKKTESVFAALTCGRSRPAHSYRRLSRFCQIQTLPSG